MDHKEQPLVGHLSELRRRALYSVLFFIASFIFGYTFAQDIYALLVYPLSIQEANVRMIYTGLTEGFFTYLRLALNTAFLFFIPFFLIQVWLFIAPGLYKGEQKKFAEFLFLSPLFFFLGGLFAYFFVMPAAWSFFLSFQAVLGGEQSIPVELMPRVSEYLSLITSFLFGFGIAFQIPLVIVLLLKLGVIKVEGLKRFRRYMIVAAFFLAAVLTPPDVLSQVFLATVLICFYELIIFFFRHSKNEKKLK